MNVLKIKEALEKKNAYIVSSNNGEKWCIGKYNGFGVDSNGDIFIVADINYDENIEYKNDENDDYFTKLNKVLKKLGK